MWTALDLSLIPSNSQPLPARNYLAHQLGTFVKDNFGLHWIPYLDG